MVPPSRRNRRRSRGLRETQPNRIDAEEERAETNAGHYSGRSRRRGRSFRHQQRKHFEAQLGVPEGGEALETAGHKRRSRGGRGKGRGRGRDSSRGEHERGGVTFGSNQQEDWQNVLIDSENPSECSIGSDICADYVNNLLLAERPEHDSPSDGNGPEDTDMMPCEDFADIDDVYPSSNIEYHREDVSSGSGEMKITGFDEKKLEKDESQLRLNYVDVLRKLQDDDAMGDTDKREDVSPRKHRHRKSGRPENSLYGEKVSGKGLDMLRKMGWEDGKGLGANADGCTEPIGVEVRRFRSGLGSTPKSDRADGSRYRRRVKGGKLPKNSLYGDKVFGKGLDMLRKMGWEDGEGLGANADGRTEPVSVDVRHDRMGLGSESKASGTCSPKN